MRRESRGVERLVSCCSDGNVVDIGGGGGGGFRERRKWTKRERTASCLGCEVANLSKRVGSCIQHVPTRYCMGKKMPCILEVTESQQCIDMRNASRKSQPDIILLTTTKKRRSKPSNIIAQTRVKKRGNSGTVKNEDEGKTGEGWTRTVHRC